MNGTIENNIKCKKMSSQHSNNKTNSKKIMNLTGTIPKGLLSPVNNVNLKHKHAEYFESASTVACNQFEQTAPIIIGNSKNNKKFSN